MQNGVYRLYILRLYRMVYIGYIVLGYSEWYRQVIKS